MLPIQSFKEEIIKTIQNNKVTIITAETGAGKSTQVPQYLLEEGYEVVVTEPRRLAAMSLAKRVSDETKTQVGGKIGYHTGFCKNISNDTKCIYCTDGLEVVKQFSNKTRDLNNKVLIIDEVHEWNLNEEVLIGWCKANLATNFFDKIIVMSATMESEKISSFFNDAPVIKVPGKVYDVASFKRGREDLISTIRELVNKGKNTLVFVPGKGEILKTMVDLRNLKIDAEILPLHAEISPEEQQKCFESYNRPKVILATTIAQTSVTIPDIDAVVDTGLERRAETVNGIEGLYTKDISQADARQRKGRAGRTKIGEYYLCSDIPYNKREEYTVAEINRLRLDQVVLRLLIHGIDMETIEFFHQPKSEDIKRAKETLYNLDLVKFGVITEIGKLVAKLPLSVKASTMLIEGIKRGVADEMMIIASIFEIGSLLHRPSLREYTDRTSDSIRPRVYENAGYGWFSDEHESDLIAELNIFNFIKTGMRNQTPNLFENISKKNYYEVYNLIKKLQDTFRGLSTQDHFFDIKKSTGKREDIIFSIFAGLKEDIFKQEENNQTGIYKGLYGSNSRILSSESCIWHCDNFGYRCDDFEKATVKYVVGKPFNTGMWDNHLTMATIIDESFLKKAPKALLLDPYIIDSQYDPNSNKPHQYRYCTYGTNPNGGIWRFGKTDHEAWANHIGYLKDFKKAIAFYKWLAKSTLSEEEFKTANEALDMAINYNQKVIKSDKSFQVFTSVLVLFEWFYYKLSEREIDTIAAVDEKSAASLKLTK